MMQVAKQHIIYHHNTDYTTSIETFWIKCPPQKRTLFIRPLQGPAVYFYTKIPESIFHIIFNNNWLSSCGFYFDIDNQLYVPPLPSINVKGFICLGKEYKECENKNQSILDIISHFWNSYFYDWYPDVMDYYLQLWNDVDISVLNTKYKPYKESILLAHIKTKFEKPDQTWLKSPLHGKFPHKGQIYENFSI